MLSFFLQDKIFHQLSYLSALFELLSIFHLISKLDTVLFSHIVWFIVLLCFPLSWKFYVCYGLNLVLAFHGVIHGLLLIAVTKVSRHRFLHTLFKCRFLRMFLIISFILPIAWLPHLANIFVVLSFCMTFRFRSHLCRLHKDWELFLMEGWRVTWSKVPWGLNVNAPKMFLPLYWPEK